MAVSRKSGADLVAEFTNDLNALEQAGEDPRPDFTASGVTIRCRSARIRWLAHSRRWVTDRIPGDSPTT